MSEIRLLIIEDEDTQIQIYKDAIEQHNKKKEQKFGYDISKTFAEGKTALKSPYYDAAIIDLKLSNTEHLEGKQLVESVYQKIRIPIIIYSGSIAQIDDIQENALLIKRLRTVLFTSILEEIISIYNTGITQFLRPQGDVDQKLTQIFWNHLSKDLDMWIQHNNSNTLLRYILSHFQEYLEINLQGDFEEYHPHEVYINPPIKKNLHTGDIVQYQEHLFIILTPACDVVIQRYERLEDESSKPIRKANNLTLVRVKDFEYKTWCVVKNKLDKGKIKDYVKNKEYRYHYLPPSINDNGYLIDFQDITSVPISVDLKRIATISSPFIKDIISRFSSYYSRQGQPTFKQDSIIEKLYSA